MAGGSNGLDRVLHNVKVIYLALIGLLGVKLYASEQKSSATPLGIGDVVESPNGQAKCYVEYPPSEDWNTVKIAFADGTTRTIWRFIRSVGVSWSPNAKYLALDDYLLRIATAVVVFRINYEHKRVELIYQTPYSNSVFDKYFFYGWKHNGDSVAISMIPDGKKEKQGQRLVRLNDLKEISPTIYH